MNQETLELLKVRVISFLYSLAGMLLSAILGILSSPGFAELVQENFGSGVLGMFVLLVVSESLKHLRNLNVVKTAKLGAAQGRTVEYHII